MLLDFAKIIANGTWATGNSGYALPDVRPTANRWENQNRRNERAVLEVCDA
jgi:hypothetical protein